MKYMLLGFLMLAGCATSHVSDYNQGCRDGVSKAYDTQTNDVINDFCNRLDLKNLRQEREEGQRR